MASCSRRAISVVDGGVLTSPSASATQVYKLELLVAGTLSIDAASKIDVSGKGYLAGRTTGNTSVGAASGDAGGSYGGSGAGDGTGGTNAVYGDYADPDDWGSGSGGAFRGPSQPGGGLVRISATDLELDGQILRGGRQGPAAAAAGSMSPSRP